MAPDSLAGDWTTEENESAVLMLASAVRAAYPIDAKRVALTGYSMGAAGTWYLAGRHPDVFSAALPVSGPAVESGAWSVPVYAVHSATDEVFPIAATRSSDRALPASGPKLAGGALAECRR